MEYDVYFQLTNRCFWPVVSPSYAANSIRPTTAHSTISHFWLLFPHPVTFSGHFNFL